MNILGIETSCDETAAAVVKDGREVLSNVVYTQIPLHQPYGGVVPEIASRAHIEKISQVVREALRPRNGLNPAASDGMSADAAGRIPIDGVAVTYGPGLSPALIVGLNAAKGLARSLDVPLIAVNHIEAHLHTPFLYDAGEGPGPEVKGRSAVGSDSVVQPSTFDLRPETCCPALGLAVSGGNTIWIDMPTYGEYHVIGETLDDAAGEAFDKAAKLLGLGYPGGLKMDRIASAWMAEAKVKVQGQGERRTNVSSPDDHLPPPSYQLIPFPKGRPREGVTALAGLPAELCVSFSGLKTALLRHVQQHSELLTSKAEERDFGGYAVTPEVARVVASYQEAIVQAVADRTRTALRRRRYKAFVLGGGVSLNSRMRAVLTEVCAEAGVPFLRAKPKYTGDNGAMIAGLAYYRRNVTGEAARTVDVSPSLETGRN